MPGDVYARVQERAVRLEISYSLTLFRLQAAPIIPAMDGDHRSRALGWCKTKRDADGDEIELGCVTAGTAPTGISITLENPATGRRNPPVGSREPDYTPYPAHFYPDALSQFGFGIPYRDRQQLARYPVDADQLGDARLIVQVYRPAAHFKRRLAVPEIRLGEWAAKE